MLYMIRLKKIKSKVAVLDTYVTVIPCSAPVPVMKKVTIVACEFGGAVCISAVGAGIMTSIVRTAALSRLGRPVNSLNA